MSCCEEDLRLHSSTDFPTVTKADKGQVSRTHSQQLNVTGGIVLVILTAVSSRAAAAGVVETEAAIPSDSIHLPNGYLLIS